MFYGRIYALGKKNFEPFTGIFKADTPIKLTIKMLAHYERHLKGLCPGTTYHLMKYNKGRQAWEKYRKPFTDTK